MAGDVSIFRASDGYAFYVRIYRPRGETRARIVLLHGIRSHTGWYESTCQTLSEQGYEVHFLDWVASQKQNAKDRAREFLERLGCLD